MKNYFNPLLMPGHGWPGEIMRQFYVLDFGSAAKITLFASDVGKGHGWTFSTTCYSPAGAAHNRRAMNFFHRQVETRRLSRQLVVLFVIAVIAVVLAVDFVVFTAMASLRPEAQGFALPTFDWLQAHGGIVLLTSAPCSA